VFISGGKRGFRGYNTNFQEAPSGEVLAFLS
jgi:hypothetical protein